MGWFKEKVLVGECVSGTMIRQARNLGAPAIFGAVGVTTGSCSIRLMTGSVG